MIDWRGTAAAALRDGTGFGGGDGDSIAITPVRATNPTINAAAPASSRVLSGTPLALFERG
jgi:hypothetical protein